MDENLKKNFIYIKKLIRIGLKEDFNKSKDITSKAIFSNEIGKCYIMAKQEGILCGIDIAKTVFTMVDKNIIFYTHKNDGNKLIYGDKIATIEGKIASLLSAERTALNILGYLSGIATLANKYVILAKGNTTILDTRKILPGYRDLAKYAVRCGGAKNHRYGLYDMILIKDNHIDASGSITNAVNKVRKKYGNKYKIEVETRTLEDVKEAIELNVDRIMLDNMDFETLKSAIRLIDNRIESEISGNVNEESINALTSLKPTYISIGSITHSAKNFDFSMKFLK